jgi:hypothetical protein
MDFGVRKSFADANPTLSRVEWPLLFAVPPQPQVVFAGFRARNDDATVERVRKVLAVLGNADPAPRLFVYDEAAEHHLDEQFKNLGL